MRSQTRGPYVAHLLSSSPALPRGVSVEILEGGFQGWWRRYRGRKELFEGLVEQETSGGAGVQGGTDQEWEDVVEADEGSAHEADDSRRLRQGGGI
ncbi:hypothetical protein Rhopal_002435-T1 [Rhodotorula paludigena]|uniref:Uncharacterized protein n=1 Tax=Rhodotorula paludigena TaxID=86838 RepID=A0AAV5GJR4_9BASI|nr:hypothetical protein Rhopal_002435-T1 [Rhodotorula paludigena]